MEAEPVTSQLPPDDLEDRLADLASLAQHVPQQSRVQLDQLVRRLERFCDGATHTPQRQEMP